MLSTISDKVKEHSKMESEPCDAEVAWDSVSATKLLYKNKRRLTSTKCCIIVPWILFLMCFLMLGCVSTWGWGEHLKLQDLLAKVEKDTAGSQTSEGNASVKKLIPYGNDALPSQPEPPNHIEEIVVNEEEVTIVEQEVIEENVVVQLGNPSEVELENKQHKDSSDGPFLSPSAVFKGPLLLPTNVIDPCDEKSEAATGSTPTEPEDNSTTVVIPLEFNNEAADA